MVIGSESAPCKRQVPAVTAATILSPARRLRDDAVHEPPETVAVPTGVREGLVLNRVTVAPSASVEYPLMAATGDEEEHPLLLKDGLKATRETVTPLAVVAGHFPASLAEAVITAQPYDERLSPLMVQLEELTTRVLFRKTPSAKRLTMVSAEEPQVPDMETVFVVITGVVITGATDVPSTLYWQSYLKDETHIPGS